jgi:hypothetical protein
MFYLSGGLEPTNLLPNAANLVECKNFNTGALSVTYLPKSS